MTRTLNLGILAHVDAGKTSLTEQILYRAGVIDTIGDVDQGTTQTDTLELERQRGITIQSAIVSFRIGDLKVNLIDTPGHPDFIAEVERALGVLDGVILVVSAVEGAQPQTRRLAHAVATAQIPLLIFANKIDRRGAREQELLDEIQHRLHLHLVALNSVSGIGTLEAGVSPRSATDRSFHETLVDLLAETSDDFLETYLECDGHIDATELEKELVSQVCRRLIVPVVFGSARTGAGVDQVLETVVRYLPPAKGCAEEPLSGTVFKIHRARSGEKIVYARLFSGQVDSRQHVPLCRPELDGRSIEYHARITGIEIFDDGSQVATTCARAGDILRLHGLKDARIGDYLGQPLIGRKKATFAPPVLESVVASRDPARRHQLNVALADLADQDPLISIRRDARLGELSVRLYGEVQKEVIAATLLDDFGVDAIFAPSTIVHVERPKGTGAAIARMGDPDNPFVATVGLQVEAGGPGSGVTFFRELGSLPLSFYTAIEETVHTTLQEGLLGWSVIDCRVTLTDVAFDSVGSTAGDFRKLTPLVLMEALRIAGTSVLEPVERFALEIPDTCLGGVLASLGSFGGVIESQEQVGTGWRLNGNMSAEAVHAFERRLTDITRGEGVLDTRFEAYAPVTGSAPCRARTDFNPLNRKLYLAQISQA